MKGSSIVCGGRLCGTSEVEVSNEIYQSVKRMNQTNRLCDANCCPGPSQESTANFIARELIFYLSREHDTGRARYLESGLPYSRPYHGGRIKQQHTRFFDEDVCDKLQCYNYQVIIAKIIVFN